MEQKKEYKLYKRRWVVLLSFVCVNAVMQYGWAFFSSIVTDAWHFYGFQDAASGEAAISALTMIIMGCMIVFSIPASWVFEKIGWYKTVSIAGIVLMVFTLLRGFIGGSSYTALVITTTGIAVTQPFIINAFGMISALWFPPAERGIANGWGMISTYLGVVMAQFGVPWLMSTFGLDIPGALKVFGFLSIPMILWFILFAREKPPTPPADEDLIKRISFADGMKQLAKNKKFIYALLVFWLLQGVYFTLTTLMEPILQFFNGGSMDSLFIGTLGTILTVTGVITTLVLPIASDRSKSKEKAHRPGLRNRHAGRSGPHHHRPYRRPANPDGLLSGHLPHRRYPHCHGLGLRVRLSRLRGHHRKPDAAGRQWLGPHLPAGCKRHLSGEPYGHSGVLPGRHRPFPGPYHDDKGSLPQGTPHRMTGSAAPNPIFSLAPPFPSGMAEPFRSVPRQIPIKAVPFSLTARLWCGKILR